MIKGQVASKDTNKWYVTSKDGNGLVTSEGWYTDSSKTSYSINLANAPAEAKYVEILCYGVDDYGNVGFFNKVVRVADATDTDMPTLYKVTNAPNSSIFEAPTTVTLPTLQYKDAKVEYMHADVTVYKVLDDGTKKVMQNSGLRTSYDTVRGIFTVNAGQFNASTEGKYQVVVTVLDSGNHSITTYFNYTTRGADVVEDPEIENISSETKTMAIDDSLYLTPPTISVTKSATYGYIGLDEDDDANTATYYTTSVVSASTSDYELDKYYFTPKAKGTFKLQYNVFLIRYDAEEAAKTNGNIKFVNDKLVYVDGSTNYYVYYEENTDGQYELHFNTQIDGLGNELTDATKLAAAQTYIKGFSLQSNVQTITVDSVVVKSLTVGDAYERTQYTTTGEELEIVRPEVVVSGKGGVNLEDSKVTITLTSSSTTSNTLATIKLSEWADAVDGNSNFTVDGNTIKLKLTRNGKYTIKYSIQAMDEIGQNVGDAKTLEYTISNGDVVGPEINFEDNFIKAEYSLGEDLVINMAGLSVSDQVTTDTADLLKTMKVKLKNEDTDQSWTLENTAEEGEYSFEHTLDVAGDYTLTITVTDTAGNESKKSISFTVTTEETAAVEAKEVLGGVLIGVSVAILAGVVAYFVVSKVKLDKKEKRYSSENKQNKK